MYIGPWQEYNLSKARSNNSLQYSSQFQAQFQNDIEKVLLTSLDPESAKKAMEAMNPLLANQQQQLVNSQQRNYYNNYLPPVDNRTNRLRNSGYNTLASLSSNRSALSARERAKDLSGASPLSVRSAQSEPAGYQSNDTFSQPRTPVSSDNIRYGTSSNGASIPHLRLPQLDSSGSVSINKKNRRLPNRHYQQPKQQFLQRTGFVDNSSFTGTSETCYSTPTNSNATIGIIANSTHQPPYNATAAVDILRLQRTKKSRMEIAKLTGWKIDSDSEMPVEVAQEQKSAKSRRSIELSTEQKLEQVRLMKQLYMAKEQEHQADQELKVQSQPSSSSSTDTKPHMHRVQHVSSDGRVVDMDLTDDQFHKISRYFDNDISLLSGSHFDNKVEGIAMGASYSDKNISSKEVNKSDDTPMNRTKSILLTDSDDPLETNQSGKSSLKNPQNLREIAIANSNRHSFADIINNGSTDDPVIRDNATANTLVTDVASPDSGNYHDELHVGGMDGLLRWSSQLDIDNL